MTQGEDWTARIGEVSRLDAAALVWLRQKSQPLAVPAGTRLFTEGSACRAYLILLSGSIRVQKVGENGREIVLYRVEAGQSCVVTTACLMSGQEYDAEGIAETDIFARALPMADFRALLAQSAGFRDFVFSAYGTRIADLLMVIEAVAFGRIDQRLAGFLLERGQGPAGLTATHQELAVELGTAREVVSRQLKEFERRGWVRLGRGQIQLLQVEPLETLAGIYVSSR